MSPVGFELIIVMTAKAITYGFLKKALVQIPVQIRKKQLQNRPSTSPP